LAKRAIFVFCCIAGENDELRQSVIDLRTLRVLPSVMKKKAGNRVIIQYCCWLIENVMKGTEHHRQAVINNGLLASILSILRTGDREAKMQSSGPITILAMAGTPAQIQSLLAEKPMSALVSAFDGTHFACCVNALEVIDKLLSSIGGRQLTALLGEMERTGVLDKLKEKLNNVHEHGQVRGLAHKILSDHFANNDEEVGR
ncbi:hypothetical protein PMAYCL1PPCAC_26458, partial [Pristionchus mayeri]